MKKILTDLVIAPTIGGAMIPGMVLSMLLIPIMTPEYLAAIEGNKQVGLQDINLDRLILHIP